MNHTFAICAYQESPYLEQCIQSVTRQSEKTEVILCTSTPNQYIQKLADKYRIPVYIREGQSDIQEDWNFAYQQAKTDYVTITHQDDVYHKDYAKEVLYCIRRYPETLIAMTDYKILNEKNQVRGDISLLIKQILKLPLRLSFLADKKFVKLAVQSLGNAICCPSVCYHKCKIQEQQQSLETPLFQSKMKYALDWETFYELAQLKGRFTYVPQILFYYRIHETNTTIKCLQNHRKIEEEMQMFSKFWPKWVVKMIMVGYQISYKSYE